jgi:enoyl-CoA hydratase
MGEGWVSERPGGAPPSETYSGLMAYQHIEVERHGHIGSIWLNRPDKLNALSADMWDDIPSAVTELDEDDAVRVIILAGRGRSFTVGIDVGLLTSLRPRGHSPATANMELYNTIKRLQHTVNSLAETPKPVVAAIHGHCLGAGANLISACDLRLAASDALFSIRETRMGLVADIGALQRLPAIVGNGVTSEMALTGADYPADWALDNGLVSRVFPDHESLLNGAMDLASQIAANSPLVTRGVKRALQANDGRTVSQALEYIAQWNAAFFISNDLMEALGAFNEKRDPDFTGT